MKLIVGLGNPGKEYADTRHNIGFMVIDVLAKRHGIYVKSRRDLSLVGEGAILGDKVILVKPMTFMNLSGQAVGQLARRYRVDISEILIICDDVNLPLGRLRIRTQGSAGGHNGLKSIIYSLSSQDFPRLRVGIGSPRGEMINHVLSRFHKVEKPMVQEAVSRAADAVETMIAEGMEAAMNKFNPAPAEG
jgi:PTH1 family peptidyl-tRNA hydrolase